MDITEPISKLKHNIVLAINTQDELNLFAELDAGISKDAVYIDEPYVAFKDSDNATQLLPYREIEIEIESYPIEFRKPRKFMSWYRKVSQSKK